MNPYELYKQSLAQYSPTSGYAQQAEIPSASQGFGSRGQIGSILASQAGRSGVSSIMGGSEAGAVGAEATASAPLMGVGALPLLGIAGGLALGGKGLKDLLAGKSGTDSPEGLGGRATLGIATGGLSEVARAFGFGSKGRDYGQEARDRISKLRESGAIREDQFQGYGTWDKKSEDRGESTKDAYNRIKATGTGKDVWGLPAFYERFGSDYEGKMSESERFKTAQDVLDSGAFIHKDHGLDVNWKKYDEWKAGNQGRDITEMYNQYKNPAQVNKPATTNTVLNALSGSAPLVIK